MSTHMVRVEWQAQGDYAANTYSRGHRWFFDGGVEVAASASPDVVPLPLSRVDAVDPEEAYVASISSCHMLWFLDFARQAGLQLESYTDNAMGHMVRGPKGLWVSKVDLNVRMTFAGVPPPRDVLESLHNKAHDTCFIANSVITEIVTNLIDA
ncbi:MAG: OsmC family protein [Rhodobacteraceae bacterium]|nr:OsmC family protein [Paracoccaceae bacterium]